jgi:hypothetical protein
MNVKVARAPRATAGATVLFDQKGRCIMARVHKHRFFSFGTSALIEPLPSRRLLSVVPYNCDVNRDGDLDGDDFFVVDSNALVGAVTGWGMGDINGDGNADASDAGLLCGAFQAHCAGQTCEPDGHALIPQPGDANSDGNIDGDDYFAMDSNPTPGHAGGWADGDFNGDGKVDGVDYIIINATCDVHPDTSQVVDGDEWWELDSVLATEAVKSFF